MMKIAVMGHQYWLIFITAWMLDAVAPAKVSAPQLLFHYLTELSI